MQIEFGRLSSMPEQIDELNRSTAGFFDEWDDNLGVYFAAFEKDKNDALQMIGTTIDDLQGIAAIVENVKLDDLQAELESIVQEVG